MESLREELLVQDCDEERFGCHVVSSCSLQDVSHNRHSTNATRERVAPTPVRNGRCHQIDEFGHVSVYTAQEVFRLAGAFALEDAQR